MNKSLLVILIVVLLLGSALGCLGCPLISWIARAPTPVPTPTRTPKPTITPTSDATDTPFPTNTPNVPPPTDTPSSPPTPTPILQPEATVATKVLNVRSGPGTNYGKVRQVKEGEKLKVVGRTEASDWLRIVTSDGQEGWVAAELVTVNTDLGPVAVAQAPPAPTPVPVPPTPTPEPPAPTSPPQPTATPKPEFQYTPTDWYGSNNPGLTRFMGEIKDTAGNPVNGVFVRAVCGSFSTISNPSGPVGWGPLQDSKFDPPGFYEIYIASYPRPCMWTLQVVDTDDKETVKTELSEAISVEVTAEKSVITANWQKNW
jgi:uncharacterized protein YraI